MIHHAARSSSSLLLRRSRTVQDLHCWRWLSAQNSPDDDGIQEYLKETLEIPTTLHKGIVKAMESIHGKDIHVQHFQEFGKEGMMALAASVEIEQKKRGGNNRKRPTREISFKIPHHHTQFDLEWKLGDSLLDVAQEHEELLGEYMEGTCGGQMSCCTCHVYIDQKGFQQLLDKPLESELDMLDLAYEPKEESRLACQVVLNNDIIKSPDKLEVTIPKGVNNVWG